MAGVSGDVGEVVRRGYWRESDARLVIETWRRSGQSAAAFGRRHRVDPRRLSRWAKALDAAAAPTFHPVRVMDREAASLAPVRVVPAAVIELVLPDGLLVRVPPGTTAHHLRPVLDAIRGERPC